MRMEKTAIEGMLLLTPRVFEDPRGFFLESWNQKALDQLVGEHVTSVQEKSVALAMHSLRRPPALPSTGLWGGTRQSSPPRVPMACPRLPVGINFRRPYHSLHFFLKFLKLARR